jgi:hypothetical protein
VQNEMVILSAWEWPYAATMQKAKAENQLDADFLSLFSAGRLTDGQPMLQAFCALLNEQALEPNEFCNCQSEI